MNGRLSEKSYRGYAKLPRLVRPMLARFDTLAVQTEAEADRFQALGRAGRNWWSTAASNST